MFEPHFAINHISQSLLTKYTGNRNSLRFAAMATLLLSPLPLSGCASISSAGPTRGQVLKAGSEPTQSSPDISIIDVDAEFTQRLIDGNRKNLFSEVFREDGQPDLVIGKGDAVSVVIWEAPPGALFSPGVVMPDAKAPPTSSAGVTLPQQMVDSTGSISVPFVGRIQVEGRTTREVERIIKSRLAGKALDPQIMVQLARNAAQTVTIVGDVLTSGSMPLTPKGERLLDALANAGGVKQAVGKTTVQVARDGRVEALSLDTIIRDPKQNIRLQANDVLTVLYQPYSFVALGATGVNAEIPFEGNGISMAQALGRMGGAQDSRADAKGVFLFRLATPQSLGLPVDPIRKMTPDGKIAVIFRFDLRKPETFFLAQSFPVKDRDIVYISNAPLADMQKFVNVVASLVYPVISIRNATQN
jgi:polysaccharide export outer membrane protein